MTYTVPLQQFSLRNSRRQYYDGEYFSWKTYFCEVKYNFGHNGGIYLGLGAGYVGIGLKGHPDCICWYGPARNAIEVFIPE